MQNGASASHRSLLRGQDGADGEMYWDHEILPQEPWVPSDGYGSNGMAGGGAGIDSYGYYRDSECPDCVAVSSEDQGRSYEQDIPLASSSSRRQGRLPFVLRQNFNN